MEIEDVISRLKNDAGDETLFPGASDELISSVEQTLKFSLPADIKKFYKFSNGLEGDYIFNILTLEGILNERNAYPADYKPNEFLIAEYMIHSNNWKVCVDIINNDSYIISDNYSSSLTNSFAEFLSKYLDGGVFELERWDKK